MGNLEMVARSGGVGNGKWLQGVEEWAMGNGCKGLGYPVADVFLAADMHIRALAVLAPFREISVETPFTICGSDNALAVEVVVFPIAGENHVEVMQRSFPASLVHSPISSILRAIVVMFFAKPFSHIILPQTRVRLHENISRFRVGAAFHIVISHGSLPIPPAVRKAALVSCTVCPRDGSLAVKRILRPFSCVETPICVILRALAMSHTACALTCVHCFSNHVDWHCSDVDI